MTASTAPPPGTTPPLPADLTIAVDTEFHDPTTLTVQAACRTPDGTVTVRVYRDASVPDIPAGLDLAAAVAPAGSTLREQEWRRPFLHRSPRPGQAIGPIAGTPRRPR